MTRAFPPEYGEGWTESQLRSTLKSPGIDLFLAKDGDSFAGFALTRTVIDETELLLIAVEPLSRGKSLGTNLLRYLESFLQNKSVDLIFLEMRSGNSAEFLYRNFGFSPIGRRIAYYRGADGTTHDAITLSKSLKDQK